MHRLACLIEKCQSPVSGIAGARYGCESLMPCPWYSYLFETQDLAEKLRNHKCWNKSFGQRSLDVIRAQPSLIVVLLTIPFSRMDYAGKIV
jgi:hypothetical protein